LIKFRHFFPILTIYCIWAISAFAQTGLTQIRDTVKALDGTLFYGTVVITWNGSSSPTGTSPAPYGTSAKIRNGVLAVDLVPSISSPSGFYLATFNSSDGLTSWVETWQVGPSTSALTLSQVRANVTTSTNSNGSTISMGQVTGLSSYLNAISSSLNTVTSSIGGFNSTVSGLTSSVANLTSIVNALQSANTTTSSYSFADGETPQGTIDGNNAVFTLTSPPASGSTLSLFRNGVLQANGIDYSISGKTITFASVSIPKSNDLLLAYYRLSGTSSGAGQTTFVDSEVPLGTINGTNLSFTLSSAPSPASSLRLFKNGALLTQNIDYTLSGSTVNFANSAVTPAVGDAITAYYRVTTQTTAANSAASAQR
jgi:hypothetical protein